MDIKWKKFSYSLTAKIIAFLLVIICYSGLLTIIIMGTGFHKIDFNTARDESYYQSSDFNSVSNEIVQNITAIISDYQSEENILSGGSITEEEIKIREENLYLAFKETSKTYNPNSTDEENHQVFREVFADRIQQAKEQLIKEDLRLYREAQQKLNTHNGLVYYAQRGETVFTNSSDYTKDYFKSNPSYMIFEGLKQELFPEDIYF